MNPVRTTRRAISSALLVAAAALSAGCAEELGPVAMPVARVRGVLKAGDRPISGGWIEFIPADGTVGNLRSARVRSDGWFEADGVAVGTNAIRLVDAPIEWPADVLLFSRVGWAWLDRRAGGRNETVSRARLFLPFATPIRRVITASPSGPLAINLVEEAARFQEERSRILGGAPSSTGERP